MPDEIKIGWGIAHDEDNLYITNGSNKIFVVNPDNFEILDIYNVKNDNGDEISELNELEMVNNAYIYAN